ncbi:transposase [Actinoplanes cyaneus]
MLPLIKSPGPIPEHPRRAMVDAILYVVRSGCSWRQLPVDFPPWQIVYWQFQQWRNARSPNGFLKSYASSFGWARAARRSRRSA